MNSVIDEKTCGVVSLLYWINNKYSIIEILKGGWNRIPVTTQKDKHIPFFQYLFMLFLYDKFEPTLHIDNS